MGYDYTDVKDFIEDRGLPDNDPSLLVAGFQNPGRYNNALFQKKVPQQQPQFEYYNPQNPNMNLGGMPAQGQYMQMPNQMIQPNLGGFQSVPQQNYKMGDGVGQAYMSQQPAMAGGLGGMQQPPQNMEQSLCAICLTNNINTVCIPCGHRCLCTECAKQQIIECPICRKKVESIV